MKSNEFNKFFTDLVPLFIGVLCAIAVGASVGWLIAEVVQSFQLDLDMILILLYYLFSFAFMIGYTDKRGRGIGKGLLVFFCITILCWIAFPLLLGLHCKNN